MELLTQHGLRMPRLGFGTWPMTGAECEAAVRQALELGYRHIDTAERYENEDAVGAGLAASGLFAFMSACGDFLLPLILLSSPELQTLPLGLFRAFLRINEIDYGLLTALAFIYLVPAVVAFGFARRFLVQTFSGGVKG